jgi:hypothetical protein
MPKRVEIICLCGCKRKKLVREADVKRGWGKFFSKSCKAVHQEKRTNQCAEYYKRKNYRRNIEDTFHPHDTYSLGQE